MTPSEIEDHLAAILADLAPDADLAAIDRRRSFRDQLDLDSMDFLRLLQALEERTGLCVPEADYGRIGTLEALVAYLAARAP